MAALLAKQVDTVASKKTRTLTKATPRVERVKSLRGDGRFLKVSSLFEERLVHSLLLTSGYVESHDELNILEWWRVQGAE